MKWWKSGWFVFMILLVATVAAADGTDSGDGGFAVGKMATLASGTFELSDSPRRWKLEVGPNVAWVFKRPTKLKALGDLDRADMLVGVQGGAWFEVMDWMDAGLGVAWGTDQALITRLRGTPSKGDVSGFNEQSPVETVTGEMTTDLVTFAGAVRVYPWRPSWELVQVQPFVKVGVGGVYTDFTQGDFHDRNVTVAGEFGAGVNLVAFRRLTVSATSSYWLTQSGTDAVTLGLNVGVLF